MEQMASADEAVAAFIMCQRGTSNNHLVPRILSPRTITIRSLRKLPTVIPRPASEKYVLSFRRWVNLVYCSEALVSKMALIQDYQIPA